MTRVLGPGCALFLLAAPALADSPPDGKGASGATATATATAAAPGPSDKGSALAEALFQEALRLARAGQLADACPKFAASQRAAPSYGAAFNLGTCHEELGQTASAWAAFTEAVPLARDAAERSDAEDRIKALTPKLIRRVIKAPAQEGLSITWDGAALDRAAWDIAVPIDPGSHRIEAAAPGKQAWTRAVEATKPGETVTLEVPPLVDLARSTWPLQRTLGIATGALGLAGVAVGGVLGALATSKWEEAKGLCYPDNTCAPPGAALGGEARTLAHGSTASFIAGGALVATGVILLLTSRSAPEQKAPSKAQIAPWIGPLGAGSTVTVTF